MCCEYKLIKEAIESGEISITTIANSLNEDVSLIEKKLSGQLDFDINEAMTINQKLFPHVNFKDLFGKISNVTENTN